VTEARAAPRVNEIAASLCHEGNLSMAAYVIAFAKVKDPAKLQEYAAVALQTAVAAGGEILARGKVADILAGTMTAERCVILKFESAAAARDWYRSAEYQRLIPVRDQGMVADFVLVEE